MLLVYLLAFFGNAIQYQAGFDFCLKHDFEFKECAFHYKMVKENNRSKHYDIIQK